ncbi:MAG: hypothetical protein OHK0028_19200 [Deltaproteobacteria bacterium]
MANKTYHLPHGTDAKKTVCGRQVEVNGRPQVLLTTDTKKKKGAVCRKCMEINDRIERAETAAKAHNGIVPAGTKKAKPAKRTPALSAFPNRPAELVVTYKGTAHRAAVNPDGTITVNGKTFTSPSRAGKEITGREVDGWTFWSYEVEGEGLKKLDTLRKEVAQTS